jgi:hypothetical protein
MSVRVLVTSRTGQGIEFFSRVPCVGEKIRVGAGFYQVLDVVHITQVNAPPDQPVAEVFI